MIRRLHALLDRLRVWPLGPDPLAPGDRRRLQVGDYEPWSDVYLDRLAAEADEAMSRAVLAYKASREEDPEC